MAELLANAAAVIDVVDAGQTGLGVITTPPSIKGLINGFGIHRGPISVTISGASAGTCVQAVPQPLIILPTSTKVRLDNLFVIREGDQVVGAVSGNDTNTGLSCSIPVTVRVASAGQVKVRGD